MINFRCMDIFYSLLWFHLCQFNINISLDLFHVATISLISTMRTIFYQAEISHAFKVVPIHIWLLVWSIFYWHMNHCWVLNFASWINDHKNVISDSLRKAHNVIFPGNVENSCRINMYQIWFHVLLEYMLAVSTKNDKLTVVKKQAFKPCKKDIYCLMPIIFCHQNYQKHFYFKYGGCPFAGYFNMQFTIW